MKIADTPYGVAEQYSRGEITREQLVKILGDWDYVPAPFPRTDGLGDDIVLDVPGSWDEVSAANFADLIDDDLYGDIYDAHRAHRDRKAAAGK